MDEQERAALDDLSRDETDAALMTALARVGAFADAMRELGIHVGISVDVLPAACVTCRKPWPCDAARAGEPIADEAPERPPFGGASTYHGGML